MTNQLFLSHAHAMDPRSLPAWNALLSSWDARLLTFTLVVIVPTLGYLRFRRLETQTDLVASSRRKLTVYARIILVQWFLVAAMLLVGWRHGLSAADLGERFADARLTLGVTAALVAIVAVVLAIILGRRRHPRPQAHTATVDRMRKLMPASGPEWAAFALVCITAGVCEELLYRGWLVSILRVGTGSVWVAVGIASAIFGIGHAYQGAKGMLRTGLVGLQLALLFVYVDSLIPGQVLHAAVDIVAGFALAGKPQANTASPEGGTLIAQDASPGTTRSI
ncbi:MAG: CPBP family intramembrane glutamic endopeptidase [Thermoanaerobaculia bacterium]